MQHPLEFVTIRIITDNPEASSPSNAPYMAHGVRLTFFEERLSSISGIRYDIWTSPNSPAAISGSIDPEVFSDHRRILGYMTSGYSGMLDAPSAEIIGQASRRELTRDITQLFIPAAQKRAA